jgi:BMFP domain-containing protein YqiC
MAGVFNGNRDQSGDSHSPRHALKEAQMQSQNPFLDEMAKLTQAAMGLAQAAGEEAKSAFRSQSDKWAAELDLIKREEFEALKAEVASLRSELAALAASKQA